MSDLDDIRTRLEAIDAMLGPGREERRRRDLLAGITAEDRERLDSEARAGMLSLAARLKAENDELEAQLNRRRMLRLA